MNGRCSLFVVAFALALVTPAGAQDDLEGRFTLAFQGGTDSEIAGSAWVRTMVRGPAPAMLNSIASGPGFALASSMARLSEPEPPLFVLVTMNVAAA